MGSRNPQKEITHLLNKIRQSEFPLPLTKLAYYLNYSLHSISEHLHISSEREITPQRQLGAVSPATQSPYFWQPVLPEKYNVLNAFLHFHA